MAKNYMGEKPTAKTMGESLVAVVIRVFGSGFNCETMLNGVKVRTFSSFNKSLGVKGDTILQQSEIVVGKEVLITTLLENLEAGKDPYAIGVVGVPTTPAPVAAAPAAKEEDASEEEIPSAYGVSYSKHHGEDGEKDAVKAERVFEKKNSDGKTIANKIMVKACKGGAKNSLRDYLQKVEEQLEEDEYDDDYDDEYDDYDEEEDL